MPVALTFGRYDQRGQTLPVWVLSVLLSLTLMLFVFNYANAVRNSVHAQNAADSAAAAALGNDAASLNSVQLLLGAFDIQELKLRNTIAAVPTLLTGGDSNCSNVISVACSSDLVKAVSDIQTNVTNLTAIQSTLQNFSGNLTNTVSNPSQAVNSLLAQGANGNCAVNVLTDCDYKYTTIVTYGSNGMPTVDEYACKAVPNLFAQFLHVNSTYYAIGHTTETLAPASFVLNPGTLGTGVQTTTSVFPSIAGNTALGSIAGLSVNTSQYAPAITTPPSQSLTAKQVCP